MAQGEEREVCETTLMDNGGPASLLLLLGIGLSTVVAAETTLESYARTNQLTVYTVTERQEKTLPWRLVIKSTTWRRVTKY